METTSAGPNGRSGTAGALLAALDRIERRWARVEDALDRADAATKTAPAIPGTITDTIDDAIRRGAEAGIDVIKRSELAGEAGSVDVHEHTLPHTRFANVFSLGDCSSLPTSRTSAAIRKQAPVLVTNLLAHRAGAPPRASYDGYASCSLITGYGRLILAELDYDGKPAESFPFDQSQERYSMYALKAHGLPAMYWNGMLRGRA